MTTNEQSEYLENSESEETHSPTNGSGEATAEGAARAFPVVRGSTGPRTQHGKERSKNNAIKHGIFCKAALLRGESQAEFNVLMSGLHEDFQPEGTFEEGLVEVLAFTRWRLRRLLIAEAAEIEAGREFLEWDETQRQLVEAGNLFQELSHCGPRAENSEPRSIANLFGSVRKTKGEN